MGKKICPVCGKTFEGRSKQIYCGLDCYYEKARKKENRVCPICGKSFTAKKKEQIYCGRGCAAFGRQKERRENPGQKKQGEIRACEWCGKEYKTTRRNQRFCCLSCSSKAKAARDARPKPEPKPCPICGKTVPARVNQMYCSRACAVEAARLEKRDTTPMGQRDKDLVRIRITRTLPVFEEMRPKVGAVYPAERAVIKRGSGGLFYVIREIGRLGLVVRENECVEV